jgi:hypothetical protein
MDDWSERLALQPDIEKTGATSRSAWVGKNCAAIESRRLGDYFVIDTGWLMDG